MNILITICARGGSKGIPGKNIKALNGKPLIAYTINAAQQFAKKYGADIGLSTDSERIKFQAATFGIKTKYLRPEQLATDTAGKIEVIKDLVTFYENTNSKIYDYILDLDITSPLRTQEDLDKALKQLQETPEALNIFSVNLAARNPYFNMVEPKEDGFVKLVKEGNEIKSRQTAPKVYEMNASFYIFRRKFFDDNYKISVTNRSLAFKMNHICFDLDEEHDFTIMELMISNNLLKFDI
jgi:CMP-N,N'-diacetyllegionaminic acid synthase